MSRDHLAIEFTDLNVRFSAFKGDIVVESAECNLGDFNETEKRSRLQSFYDAQQFLKDDFNEITLSWFTPKTTIIPNNIFTESTPAEMFTLCFGNTVDEHEIDYNRISEQSVINLYHIPNWIKSFFVIRYPRIIIQHEGSHLIRKAMQKGFKLKVYLILHENHFQMAIVKHNKLEYYSSFDYQSYEDVLYHLVFVLQQKELTNESGEIVLINGAGSSQKVMSDITENIKRIKDLSEYKVDTPEQFIAKSQLLCV